MTGAGTGAIFKPIGVKGVEFANRVVMAPMANFHLPSAGGVMGDELLRYYLDFTDKGIGLMILQALFVMPSFADMPWACAPEHMVPLKRIADAAHAHGSRVFPQLVMNGREFADQGSVNGLSTADMERIRDAFVASARLCKEAGFDGVELHGAHELFLNQVSSPLTNRRTDRYGQGAGSKLNFAREIIAGICEFADDRFLVSYRMGASFDLEEDARTARALEEAGLDMLHVSYGITDAARLEIPQEFAGYDATAYAGCFVKRQVGIPTIVVSGLRTLARGDVLIERGDADFAAYGRPFLRDPAFALRSL